MGFKTYRVADKPLPKPSVEGKSSPRNEKENKYDSDKFVSPLEQECEKKFTYYGNGTIVGDEYTINLLNLNDYELREARKAVYQQLQHLDKETIKLVYMNEQDEEYQPYYNVIKWYVNG